MQQTRVTHQELAKTICNNMQWVERQCTACYNHITDFIDEEGRIMASIVRERAGNVYYLWK